jgi:hydrogenase expression/formation protein HypE
MAGPLDRGRAVAGAARSPAAGWTGSAGAAGLVRDRLRRYAGSELLAPSGEAAVLPVHAHEVVLATDTFVAPPLEFPGGDLGALAVYGTLNEVAVMGARPSYLSASLVVDERLPLPVLDRIVRSMAAAAAAEEVVLVAEETVVVPAGRLDGLLIHTSGLGILDARFRPAPAAVRPGDVVLVSGPVGEHGAAMLAPQAGAEATTSPAGGWPILTDTGSVFPMVVRLRLAAGEQVRALRVPSRQGLAGALWEVAAAAGVGVELDEEAVPVTLPVRLACEAMERDPLFEDGRGVLVAFVAEHAAEAALRALRAHPRGRNAARVGRVVAARAPAVTARRRSGERDLGAALVVPSNRLS